MSRLFPFRSNASSAAENPKILDIEEDAADDVFDALASSTARTAYKSLHDEPRTASDLADATDTTVQNVRYHLDNLQDAGLVEVVDTWYSDRGTEMNVYAPTDTSLVVFAGDDDDQSTLRTVLRDLVGGVGVLALAAVAVQRFATDGPVRHTGSAPDTDEYTQTTAETVTYATRTVETTVSATPDTVAPGLAFFLGGLAVLLGGLAYRYVRGRRSRRRR